jgi:hypothetical protein
MLGATYLGQYYKWIGDHVPLVVAAKSFTAGAGLKLVTLKHG